jgi:hypothetical protein
MSTKVFPVAIIHAQRAETQDLSSGLRKHYSATTHIHYQVPGHLYLAIGKGLARLAPSHGVNIKEANHIPKEAQSTYMLIIQFIAKQGTMLVLSKSGEDG